jgi:hypothetical protein
MAMNRGINKVVLTEPEQKGKSTRANPIRVDVLVSRKMDERITEIAEAMKIEKAAAVRMLIWFGLRFAPSADISEIFTKKSYRADGQATNRLDTRITQEVLEGIEKLMGNDKRAKSSVIKTLLYWALANIGNYTIADWLAKS